MPERDLAASIAQVRETGALTRAVFDDGALCGLLDWTEGQLTDPVIDFAMFHGCFGRPATAALVERFVAHGGVAWPGLLDHAAMRWSMFPALGAAWALKANIPGFVDQVVAHFRSQLA